MLSMLPEVIERLIATFTDNARHYCSPANETLCRVDFINPMPRHSAELTA